MISVHIQRYQVATDLFPTTFRCGTFSCLDFSFRAALQLGLGLERQVFVPVAWDRNRHKQQKDNPQKGPGTCRIQGMSWKSFQPIRSTKSRMRRARKHNVTQLGHVMAPHGRLNASATPGLWQNLWFCVVTFLQPRTDI